MKCKLRLNIKICQSYRTRKTVPLLKRVGTYLLRIDHRENSVHLRKYFTRNNDRTRGVYLKDDTLPHTVDEKVSKSKCLGMSGTQNGRHGRILRVSPGPVTPVSDRSLG